ncbi:hypothetical protein OTK49_20825 [Vibrio coralliirubri]|uniref:hypothetical protein n=1 Tax=Vibrio coralliirubri TaxID=1516159 RepID=UPI002283982B|nr:hypothetical protein [Vibrio coralliirubri]MCY9864963.1 hypothetical protein [Vibrio coralliirubri]
MRNYQILELTKANEGMTIFVRGADNNLIRGGVTPVKEAVVVKVMRKNMILSIQGREITLRTNGTTESHFNYDMFATLDDFKAQIGISKIREKMNYSNDIEPSKILLAAEILGIDIDIEKYTK